VGDEAAKWRDGGCFFVSAGGAPLVAVRMKNKLSSMIVFIILPRIRSMTV
jgi:hypothetical protein